MGGKALSLNLGCFLNTSIHDDILAMEADSLKGRVKYKTICIFYSML